MPQRQSITQELKSLRDRVSQLEVSDYSKSAEIAALKRQLGSARANAGKQTNVLDYETTAHCVERDFIWITNILFLFCGLGVIGLGAYLEIGNFADWAGQTPSIFMIIVGCFIVLVASLGIFGTWRYQRHRNILISYTIGLALLIILQVTLLAVVGAEGSDGRRKFLQDRWDDLELHTKEDLMDDLDCGQDNSSDAVDCSGKKGDQKCFDDCYNDLLDMWERRKTEAIVVGICVAAIEIMLMLAAISLLCASSGSPDSGEEEESGDEESDEEGGAVQITEVGVASATQGYAAAAVPQQPRAAQQAYNNNYRQPVATANTYGQQPQYRAAY